MKRRIIDGLKRCWFYAYKIGVRLGVHILPVHFYSPIPSIIEMEKSINSWAQKSNMPGIHVDLNAQVNNLRNICLPFQAEYDGTKYYREAVNRHFGSGYEYIDSQALHAVLRYFKPKNVIEVGCGVSTYCILKALELNRKEMGNKFSLTCIDPYPSREIVKLMQNGLIQKKVQTIPLDFFQNLGSNDLLFIDSTHAVKTGSDVNYLYLEVLPRLKSGVIVHFHDINFPYDYERIALKTLFPVSEMSLLRAFLIHNNKARILFCLSNLHYERRDVLLEIFPNYDPQANFYGMHDSNIKPFTQIFQHFPSSIYITIT